jgi:hypothetical protein
MCLICGEGGGYLDNGSRCWGCNYDLCKKCGRAKMPYDDVPCSCEMVYVSEEEKDGTKILPKSD